MRAILECPSVPPLLHFQNWHTCSLTNGHAFPWLTSKLSLEGSRSGGQSSPHICAVDSPDSSHLRALLLPPLSHLYLPSASTDVCPGGNSSLSQVNKRSPFPMALITIFLLFAFPVSSFISPSLHWQLPNAHLWPVPSFKLHLHLGVSQPPKFSMPKTDICSLYTFLSSFKGIPCFLQESS